MPQLREFKTYSLFYSRGFGLWVLNSDATNPRAGTAWHPLRFDHGHIHQSSYLTHAGQEEAMEWQRNDQSWAYMLLPTTYHGAAPPDPRYGGLVGELSILLGLAALSMPPANLQQWLPWMFQESQWRTHALHHGREFLSTCYLVISTADRDAGTHKRGVVVTVYLCPPNWAGGGSQQDLLHYETGESRYGKYYN